MNQSLLAVGLVITTVAFFSLPTTVASQDLLDEVHGVSWRMRALPAGSVNDSVESRSSASWLLNGALPGSEETAVASFYLAETEVTWALYERCQAAGACPDNTIHGGDNGWGRGQRPVIEVSYDDFQGSFLPWLRTETGRPYRLPTEAEWQYAAQAGASGPTPWAQGFDCQSARFGYMSGECGAVVGSLPVKSFPPNAWGLYDMQGNVWEFVDDCWNDQEPCEEIVLKGGSWLNSGDELRSGLRAHHHRTYRESGDGFRLALDRAP
ncbi:MAG: SUMF1/EgtB/PvdO family nonheme iron enzyme [Pseudomonadota bacterium]